MLSSLSPRLASLALLGAALALWLIATLVVRLSSGRRAARRSRSRRRRSCATTPAVVNLLLNGGQVTSDAARATVLDLAARRILELEQPGNDPGQTTVWVRDQNPRGLLSFEQRVLDRVKAAAARAGWRWRSCRGGTPSTGCAGVRSSRYEVREHATRLGLVAKPLEELGGPMVS